MCNQQRIQCAIWNKDYPKEVLGDINYYVYACFLPLLVLCLFHENPSHFLVFTFLQVQKVIDYASRSVGAYKSLKKQSLITFDMSFTLRRTSNIDKLYDTRPHSGQKQVYTMYEKTVEQKGNNYKLVPNGAIKNTSLASPFTDKKC